MASNSLTSLQLHHSFPYTKRTPLLANALAIHKKSNSRLRAACGILRSSRLVCCRIVCKAKATGVKEDEEKEESLDSERKPFDINLAVVLAGFAFEAYTSPPENVGRKEVDAADCKTVYLSESFVREIYDGQLFVKLKSGKQLPAMDPWGTSDPYVVIELDGQVTKSKVKWGTKEPTWDEEFIFNIKQYPTKSLKVAAWDANLVTPHKRMGNTCVDLEHLCDGSLHEVLVELEGMGGGGKLHLEVKFKSFDEIDGESVWWRRIPFVEEFLRKNGFESAIKMLVGSESVPARQFVEYAFGQVKTFKDVNLWKERLLNKKYDAQDVEKPIKSGVVSELPSQFHGSPESSVYSSSCNVKSEETVSGNEISNQSLSDPATQDNNGMQSEKQFWQNLTGIINESVAQKLGVPFPENFKWDGFDLLNKFGSQSRNIAEAGYIESGLAVPEVQDISNNETATAINAVQQSLPDIKKATQDVIKQTESVFGTLMVLTAAVSQLNKEASAAKDKVDNLLKGENDVSSSKIELHTSTENDSMLDTKRAEEMKTLFTTAESAMEAWAMLATSLGHPSLIKSEFEKLCFIDNSSTDTQVAVWRDSTRKRLVVAFRGTEQAKWKDLLTDLMLAPAGLNPERIGGDFKQEVQVHSGFLSAYDSVRIRIISLIKLSIGYIDDCTQLLNKWHIYVTGHSLGGALATLLALELSSSQMAKHGAVSVTMYNFGSPRVGNKIFADVYNEKVKDSWRIVNHRDIIPTVPRLMGYCHVAQPVYLAAGGLTGSMVNMELLGDGYQGDIIGEYTPDVLVTEFMKGEKELLEKILQTEINIFRSIRDGSALMQHMEDFYYINLLESVRSNYRTASISQSNIQDGIRSA